MPLDAFANAVDDDTFRKRWRAFCRDGDVLVAWSQRTLDLLAPHPASVMVKAVWCNLRHQQAGQLADVVAGLGLAVPVLGLAETGSPFQGRTAGHLSELRALLAWLGGPVGERTGRAP